MKTTPPALSFVCPARNQIVGEGPVRYCHLCDRAVHNLSAMTQAEAQAFLAICGGQEVCVSYRVAGSAVRHRAPSTFGRITLALGLGVGGLAVAQVAVREAPEPPRAVAQAGAPGGGAAGIAPTTALQDLVRDAVQDAERGWPSRDAQRARLMAQARGDRAAGDPADPPREGHTADGDGPAPPEAGGPGHPPPVPSGTGYTMGTFSPPMPAADTDVEVDGLLSAHPPARAPVQGESAGLPERLSRQQILMVVKTAAPEIRDCRVPGEGGTVMVAMVIEPDGHVASASAAGAMRGTPTGDCVEAKVSGFQFPQFAGEPMRINMPFGL